MIRISPTSYHIIPRAIPRSWPSTSDEHEISPDCPIRCLSTAIGFTARLITRRDRPHSRAGKDGSR